jgi:hypothetical protein
MDRLILVIAVLERVSLTNIARTRPSKSKTWMFSYWLQCKILLQAGQFSNSRNALSLPRNCLFGLSGTIELHGCCSLQVWIWELYDALRKGLTGVRPVSNPPPMSQMNGCTVNPRGR